MTKTDRDKIDKIIKLAFQDSFDELEIYHTKPENIKGNDPALVIDGTKSGKTFSFKYTQEEVINLYTDGTLNRELLRARDRVLKETY
jgi:hypothetical protein